MKPDHAHNAEPAPAPTHGLAVMQASHVAQTDETMAASPDAMMMEGHKAIWAHFANMILGVWLITTPFSLGYGSTRLEASDLVSGALVIVFGVLSLYPRFFWAPWANSLVGVWLLAAPLIFWAPTAGAYANDTLAGALVIVFAILVPMPGMRTLPGPDAPPGWSYNPSTWSQRAPIIVLGLIGFFLSRQMAAFELGHIHSFADPIFGPGTQNVLTSTVSRSFPIPDAGLGAFAYMIEFLMGFMGDKCRWRTMPWMVMFFGILVVPLGVVSITLIILQPLMVGGWCTPCLAAGLAMLIMIPLTLDEVVAMLQFLVQARREGQPLWQTFWMGGALKALPETGPVRPDVVRPLAMFWGMALPWNLLLSAGLGIWLMFAPTMFGSAGTAAHSDNLFGALVVTVAIIAMADVGRATRYLNVLFGAWVVIAPWLMTGATTGAKMNATIAGGLIVLLSYRRSPVSERYGSYTRFIR